MNKRNLLRAAAILRREAESLRLAHCMDGNDWAPIDGFLLQIRRDHADHDEMIDIAKKLEQHARSIASAAGAEGKATGS